MSIKGGERRDEQALNCKRKTIFIKGPFLPDGMAKLRKGVAYRALKRPYTRKSKFKKKAFIRGVPVCKVIRFDMGAVQKQDSFLYTVQLQTKVDLQIRHNALESARQTCNRLMEGTVGKSDYAMKVRVYPHHVLRENVLATGAGADRMSTGMAASFGKVVGIAAQLRAKQPIFDIYCNAQHLPTAKQAMVRAKNKLPCPCMIVITKNSDVKAK